MRTIVRTHATSAPSPLAAFKGSRPACAETDPELHFPNGNTGPALLQIEEAKAVCRRCPLMESCLQGALERNEHYGVWGGLSEDERRALKRRAARSRNAA
ncbi:WhiB family transcriptional regulator [Streptomyces sp. NPDC092307]|uniref:WhiB family transcriptional regulator n=1 Tax=Streptomyces sp. NPDC092307 TaxID=3366013 RepID=UPI00380E1A15